MNLSLYVSLRLLRLHSRSALLSTVAAIAVTSIAVGSLALVIALSVLEGFERELERNTVIATGHLRVVGFQQKVLTDTASVAAAIKAHPSVTGYAPFVAREAMLRSKVSLDGVTVLGVVPASLGQRTPTVVEGPGFSFSSASAREVIVGQRLATSLGLTVGSEVVLFAQGRDDSPSSAVVEQLTVRAIYRTGMSHNDALNAYMPLETAQEVFEIPHDAVTGYEVITSSLEQVQRTAAELDEQLPYPAFSKTVFELFGPMFAWIDLQKIPIPIVLTLISIVAIFNVVATLLIMVVEKVRTLGTLRALGMPRSTIVWIFMSQGFFLGAIGTSIGCGVGYGLLLLQAKFSLISLDPEIYFLNTVPVAFVWWHAASVAGFSLLLSLAATLLPSILASKISPVRAVRFS